MGTTPRRPRLAAERAMYEKKPTTTNKAFVEWATIGYDKSNGRYREAVARGKKLLPVIKTLPWAMPTFLSEIAEACLGAGDAAAALRLSTRAARMQQAQLGAVGGGFHSPAVVWWTHHRALQANRQRAAAWQALQQAYTLLLEGIASLTDEGLRRSYLHAAQGHAPLLRAWIAQARATPAGCPVHRPPRCAGRPARAGRAAGGHGTAPECTADGTGAARISHRGSRRAVRRAARAAGPAGR